MCASITKFNRPTFFRVTATEYCEYHRNRNTMCRKNAEFWILKQMLPTITILLYKLMLKYRLRLKCDGTRSETRFRLSARRRVHWNRRGASVQSSTGSRGVRISGSNVDTPCSEVVWRVLATHSIRQFPFHFPSRASSRAITFQLDSSFHSCSSKDTHTGNNWSREGYTNLQIIITGVLI
jgi:hypothetical protein